MGSPESKFDGYNDERPQHEVVLTQSFEILKNPVTQVLWEALMGTNPSDFKGPDRPVERVSWFDAVAFCNALSHEQGLEEAYMLTDVRGKPGGSDFQATVHWKGRTCLGYRLPTEAEWEYACRAASTGPRYDELDEIAWYESNSANRTHPVKQKRPNAWGLHDTLGNVFEWCWDWKESYFPGTITDPAGPPSGTYRVYRGGSWNYGASGVRSAHRRGNVPGLRDSTLGIRIVRSVL